MLRFILLSILIVMESSCNGQSKSSVEIERKPAVAGSFYPADARQLKTMLQQFFDSAKVVLESTPQAIIVPHAGYVFSGEVAASAFKQIDRDTKFKHIFIIGSSHTMYFNGASIFPEGSFITPMGKVPIDPLAKELIATYNFINGDIKPHEHEHSIEVQLPFLQYWLKNEFSIIPIIIGGESQSTSTLLAESLAPYFNEENLFIVSSDFSHYPSYIDAKLSDEQMATAILSNSALQFMKAKLQCENKGISDLATAMCGWASALTLLKITENKNDVVYKTIFYKNSGDSPYGDKDRVVGYWAIAEIKDKTTKDFSLTQEDKKQLLELARKTIDEQLSGEIVSVPNESMFSANLLSNAGAFVTLRKEGQLRGCIGNFSTNTPLYKVVMSMAIAAATEDYRFEPVTKNEMNNIDIEISVLTPMKKINSIEEFIPGKHGIYIKKGNRSGTFLPQVGSETGWSREELLGHCSRDKAFIGWDGWKDAELYIYEAIVFDEKEINPRR